MRISEIATAANVSLSAVKFYQREGLLPPGEKSAANQASYGPNHVHRVRLVRALMETGGLSVAATKEVIAVLDADGVPLAETFAVAQSALSVSRKPTSAARPESLARVESLMAELGWAVTAENPGFETAARALDGFDAISYAVPDDYVNAYARAAALAARADVEALGALEVRDAIAELMVVGTVLGDPLFAGLRRLAQEDVTHDLFPVDPTNGASA